jgi:hypothetical protein
LFRNACFPCCLRAFELQLVLAQGNSGLLWCQLIDAHALLLP